MCSSSTTSQEKDLAVHQKIHCINLPPYILPPGRTIDGEDVEYLKRRGALSIPEPSLRDQLLLSFILYVNPFIPVLDLQDLINAIEGQNGARISLILFQAIMFAGTAFVDSQLLIDAGFKNRMEARTFFFRKIKVRLFDLPSPSEGSCIG